MILAERTRSYKSGLFVRVQFEFAKFMKWQSTRLHCYKAKHLLF